MKQSNTTFSFISRLIIKLLELNQKLCLVLISMKKVNFIIQSLRPYQWIKNGFVFLPLIFAKELFDIRSFFTILQATLIFCLLTGAVYLINDISDLESDRNHPRKRYRPLAAGDISVKLAAVVAVVLLLISLLSGYMIGVPFLMHSYILFYFPVRIYVLSEKCGNPGCVLHLSQFSFEDSRRGSGYRSVSVKLVDYLRFFTNNIFSIR